MTTLEPETQNLTFDDLKKILRNRGNGPIESTKVNSLIGSVALTEEEKKALIRTAIKRARTLRRKKESQQFYEYVSIIAFLY